MKKMSLEEIKHCELGVLKYLHQVCVENNLKYYLMFGTLIGAVRHQGFIPWDDDVDVVMPREDYEKLLSILYDSNSKYRIINHHTNKEYPWLYSKLVDSDTVVHFARRPIIHGIGCWVDIFPIDTAPNDIPIDVFYRENKEARRLIYVLVERKYAFNKYFPRNCVAYVRNRLKRLFLKNKDLEEEYNQANALLQKYNSIESDYCITPLADTIYEKKWFENCIEVVFEGQMFKAPSGYDSILKSLYGDYMTPPPVGKRNSGHSLLFYWKKK